MKEAENSEELRRSGGFFAGDQEEIIALSELLRSDALRYDRPIDVEEDANEL